MRFIYSKTFAVFASLLVVAALLVTLQVRGLLWPISSAVLNAPRPLVTALDRATRPTKDFFATVYQLNKISRQNAQLQNQVIKLDQELVDYNQALAENQQLKTQMGFVQTGSPGSVPCTVLSKNPLGLNDVVVLNCGSSNGIAQGQAVVWQGSLVGKIIYADRTSSTALLLTSSGFSTDATISNSGAEGLVRGSFGSGLVLDQLSQQDQTQKGWLVVTAGLDNQIPKNILIGQIGDVLSGQQDIFKSTSLISPVDFDNLEFVMVIK